MGQIIAAHAWANNEVAYVAWDIDGKIEGCLGFEITRVYLNDDETIQKREDGSEDRVKCAAWVAFSGQSNPDWLPQDTGVWPVQKLSWRDVTLRRKRDRMVLRPAEAFVRYEIRPVGDLRAGLDPVPPNGHEFADIVVRDNKGQPKLGPDGKPLRQHRRAYIGEPRPLGYLGAATVTNSVRVTAKRGCFQSTFTNGILAAQWLRNVLNEDGVIDKNELIDKISNPNDPHRKYLAGDVLPLVHELLARPGSFYLSLYELDDKELVDLLVANADRIHIILSNSGTEKEKKVWDVRNSTARERLKEQNADIQDRMFNNSTHIGHNKFVVHVPPEGGPRTVLTGSTNWTSTGVAGQTNNMLLIEDEGVAAAFLDYWNRLKADVLPTPSPLSAPMDTSCQGKDLRASDVAPSNHTVDNYAVQVWYSPNRPECKKPTKKPVPVPPDLEEVYRRLHAAEQAILFLAFYPGQRGNDCIIGEAIDIGRTKRSLLVAGAVSSPQAMPNYVPKSKLKDKKAADGGGDGDGEGNGDEQNPQSPATYEDGNISIVRAARIDERSLLGDLGIEQITARNGFGAIIHDKIVVIDPRSPKCSVILGSHNLGFKASYCNDENMVIVSGDQDLAIAYAVHVLDVYDHYRFRAIQNDLARQHKSQWSGFLDTDDKWQDGYVAGRKGALMRYFAR